MLVLACSPHAGGATDYLANAVRRGAKAGGAPAVLLQVRDYDIAPCTGCQTCARVSHCPLAADGADELFALLRKAPGAVLVAPIYFYALPGQFKLFIDRSQKFWQSHCKPRDRKPAGVLLAAGRARGEKLFAGAFLTLKYFLALFDYEIVAQVLLRGLDFACPDAAPAEELGRKIADLASARQ